MFVHRVGRTARMGRTGHALTLLLPHETAYVDFLRIRKVRAALPFMKSCEVLLRIAYGLLCNGKAPAILISVTLGTTGDLHFVPVHFMADTNFTLGMP